MIRLYLLLLFMSLISISNAQTLTSARDSIQLQRLADSLRAELVQLRDYKTLLDEKLTNKTAELENRYTNFENRYHLLLWVISLLGVGALIGVCAGYISAKRIVQERLIKIFEENNREVVQLFIERSEEGEIRRSSHILVLSPVNEDGGIPLRLVEWRFKSVTPQAVALGDNYPTLTTSPDCLFFNNKSTGFDDRIDQIILHYKGKFPKAVLFYFGSKHLPLAMTEYVATANLQPQIPGNLLNALKFRPTT